MILTTATEHEYLFLNLVNSAKCNLIELKHRTRKIMPICNDYS